jgi:hypothetical protein
MKKTLETPNLKEEPIMDISAIHEALASKIIASQLPYDVRVVNLHQGEGLLKSGVPLIREFFFTQQ